MKINKHDIKNLRDISGLGVVKCRDLLLKFNGDLNKAIKHSNVLLFNKKSNYNKKNIRIVKTGSYLTKVVIFEICVDTDFVSLNSDFKIFCNNILKSALYYDFFDLDDFLLLNLFNSDLSIKSCIDSFSNRFKENIYINRISFLCGSNVSFYCHLNKIGVILSLKSLFSNFLLSKNIAMHIAAMLPNFISSDFVFFNSINDIREVFFDQLRRIKKSDLVLSKIINGKMLNFYTNNCLYNQCFVKNSNYIIGEILFKYSSYVDNFIFYKINKSSLIV